MPFTEYLNNIPVLFFRTKHRHVLQALQQKKYYIYLQAVQKENTKKCQNAITGIFLSNSVHTELKNNECPINTNTLWGNSY